MTFKKERVKVACFDFTSCEGCQLSKINLEDEIVPLVTNFIEFVTFREAMDPISDDYEIAFVEGSISTPAGVKRVRKIRRIAKYLVAMGHCATHGGPLPLPPPLALSSPLRAVNRTRPSPRSWTARW